MTRALPIQLVLFGTAANGQGMADRLNDYPTEARTEAAAMIVGRAGLPRQSPTAPGPIRRTSPRSSVRRDLSAAVGPTGDNRAFIPLLLFGVGPVSARPVRAPKGQIYKLVGCPPPRILLLTTPPRV